MEIKKIETNKQPLKTDVLQLTSQPKKEQAQQILLCNKNSASDYNIIKKFKSNLSTKIKNVKHNSSFFDVKQANVHLEQQNFDKKGNQSSQKQIEYHIDLSSQLKSSNFNLHNSPKQDIIASPKRQNFEHNYKKCQTIKVQFQSQLTSNEKIQQLKQPEQLGYHKPFFSLSNNRRNSANSLQQADINKKLKQTKPYQVNFTLQKKINWLKEEIQMHLEIQTKLTAQKQKLKLTIMQRQEYWKDKLKNKKRQNIQLKQRIQQRNLEIQQLRISVEQNISLINSSKYLYRQYKQPELIIEKEEKLKLQCEAKDENSCANHHIKDKLQKLLAQNKYLGMQIHTLTKIKSEAAQLQRQNAILLKQKLILKKKIQFNIKKSNKKPLEDPLLFQISESSIQLNPL